ncbi:MAG: plastocyanin/azurin family copper-binding protein [Alphaproteobacteria bacterium]|nr:plastocyanin/azurin family copper-binding protein [Alphaproteobacteria bacterium]
MKKVLSSLLYLSIISIIAFGCSSSTEGETVVTDEGQSITKSTVSVTMNEWDVKVDPNYKMGKHIKPGELTLTLKNEGNLEHNLVLLNNNKHEDLELSADGSMADESKLDILGKIEGIQPGESGELVIADLPAGTYAFICNTPGHYDQGMVYKFIAR